MGVCHPIPWHLPRSTPRAVLWAKARELFQCVLYGLSRLVFLSRPVGYPIGYDILPVGYAMGYVTG